MTQRREAWTAPPPKVTQGTLWKYTKLVTDASHGAITGVFALDIALNESERFAPLSPLTDGP